MFSVYFSRCGKRMGGVVLDLAGTCSHEIEWELSPQTVWLVSALMVVRGASEKARLGYFPGVSEIGGAGACRQNIKVWLAMTQWPERVVPADPSPWAACLFGTPIPSGRPMSLHLCLVMSTRFACSVQACGGFPPGSLVFPYTWTGHDRLAGIVPACWLL